MSEPLMDVSEDERQPELVDVPSDLLSRDEEDAASPEAPTEPEVPTFDPAYVSHLERSSAGLRNELLKERNRRKEYERTIEDRFRQISGALAPKEPPPPSLEDDPAKALATQNQEILSRLKDNEYRQAQQIAAAQDQTFRQTVSAAERDFVAQAPDYYDTLNAGRYILANVFMAQGCPEDDLPRAMQEFEAGISATALRNGQNPANLVYGLAKRVVTGFQQASAPSNGQGAPQPAPQPQTAVRTPPKSLSQTSGAAQRNQVTIKEVMEDQDLFEAIYKEYEGGNDRRWRELHEKGYTTLPR